MKPVVLQLIDSFHVGGSERQAVQLTKLLHESGRFRVLVACLTPDGVLRREVEALNLGPITAYPLQSFRDRNALAQLRRFVRYLRSERVSVLQTHDFYTNVFGMFTGALARVPVRIASRRETTGMRSGAQQRVERVAYSRSHRIVANSAAVRRQLISEGVPEKKIAVVYNGLDAKRLTIDSSIGRAECLERLGLPAALADQPIVTIVANMRHDVKDYPMFLRAAARVKAAVPGARFLLAGEGELMPAIQSEAEQLNLGAAAIFLGRCQKLAELLFVADVCVLTSKAEGFSNSILEYMAAGRAVVATDVGGAGEAIIEGETGFLVAPSDDAAMAERIIPLLKDPAKSRAMGALGRSVVTQKFSQAAQLRNIEKLYDDLLRVRGNDPARQPAAAAEAPVESDSPSGS